MIDSMIEHRETFQAWLKQRQEQVVNLDSYTPEPSQYQKIPIYYDDDDAEESSTPLRDIIISELASCIAITPVLTTKEPVDSLIMDDEHLDTISATESDEFIKSSVEDLVLTPSESDDLFDIESKCDVPVCDNFTTSSNPLFDSNDVFSSSDDESFSDQNIPKEIYSNPLFDEEIISTKVDQINNEVLENISIDSSPKIDSLLDEFFGELTLLKSIPPRIDDDNLDPEGEIHLVERLLYDNSSSRPPKELNVENSIESFSPSPIPVKDGDSLMEEIDLFLTPDDSMPPGIKNDDYDSEGDIIFLEELLSNDSPSLPKNESFYFDIPSSPRPPAKSLDDGIYFKPDTGILTTKVVGDISEHYVLMPRLLPTQPTLCPMINTLLLFSSENEDKVHLLSHQGFKASKLFYHKGSMLIHGENTPNLGVRHLHLYPPCPTQVWGNESGSRLG
ncbi:hypothetical protein Tco_0241552 [Tanacetum coccineum]